MRLKQGYLMTKLGDNTYLLPYGQAAANLENPVRLGGVGEHIISLLENDISENDLIQRLVEKYGENAEEKRQIKSDIKEFVYYLIKQGYIEDGVRQSKALKKSSANQVETETSSGDMPCDYVAGETQKHYFRIAGITIRINAPLEFIHRDMKKFETFSVETSDICIRTATFVEGMHDDGELVLKNKELSIAEDAEKFIVNYIKNNCIKKMNVKKDGSFAEIFLRKSPDGERATYSQAAEFHYAVRSAFLLHAQSRGMAAIHSASVLIDERAALISAPSGIGKTTLAGSLKRKFGTRQLNGDLNLIGFQGNDCVSYGIPWCGTSHVCTGDDYPVGTIVFLKRGRVALANNFSKETSSLHIIQRMISPAWTRSGLEKNIEIAKKIAENVPCLEFWGTKGENSAEILYNRIR